ncbi:hypothetical protein BJV77DRAFT_1069469 [Russula vinacea]|nr:hypothetical protein BJV77DRAFT_1069469 [Russula vinacea]
MRLSSYIPFFFLFGTLVLAAPAEPASNLNPRVVGGSDVNWKRNSGGGGGGQVDWKRAFGDVGRPLL